MIGAIILAYRKREKKTNYFNHFEKRSSAVEIKEVSFDKGVKIDD